ncbi:MAG: hypothetical protein M1827_000526 [Pycnora praestabilis]|nr:MAG: hypothetical protein M1827_000526 [Pycnora praestabilis]
MQSIILALAVFLVSWISIGLYKLIKYRATYKNLPGPPHHPIFGHIPIMGRMRQIVPKDLHPHALMTAVQHEYNLGNLFYLDLWPLAEPLLIIGDPQMAALVTQSRSLPKHPDLRMFLLPLAGEKNMITMEGEEWKFWRSIFNPGFSQSNLMTLVPGIVDLALIFCDTLSKHAEADSMFGMEEETSRLTVDVIGWVALDTQLKAQTTENTLVYAMRKQTEWMPKTGMSYLEGLLPHRIVAHWWYGRTMDEYIGRVLDERFASRREGKVHSAQKHVIDLALETYHEEQQQKGQEKDDIRTWNVDGTFRKFAIDNFKTFVFAGHDTTSSTICYIYHLLGQHPEALMRVRQEHDEVFGTNLDQAPLLMKEDPYLLNKLPYSLAIIKEVLRLHPAATTIRNGQDDFVFTHSNIPCPTAGQIVWVNQHTINRRADLYPSPHTFSPSRFMPPATVPKDVWRAFEKGPRNCIGQELSLLEMKIIMVLTLRRFEAWSVFEEFDRKTGRKAREQGGPVKEAWGERAYQTFVATAKPSEGMPMRVKMRDLRGDGTGITRPLPSGR